MDIRVLFYFLAAAREESISGAEESLHHWSKKISSIILERRII